MTLTALLWGRSNAMWAQQYWDATKTSGTYTLNNDHNLANPVSLTGNLTITSNGSSDYTIKRTAHQPVGSYENAFSAMFITNGDDYRGGRIGESTIKNNCITRR